MSHFGHNHAYIKKLHKHKKRSGMVSVVDKSIYVIAIFAVAANFPQFMNIWVEKNSAGVSIISWTGFLIGSFFWLWYGLLHKEMPIIFINFLLIIVQSAIVLGLVANKFNLL